MTHDVEAYLNGELQGEALEAFERELQQNPALQAELAQQRDIMDALKHISLRERIAEAADQNRRERSKRNLLLALSLLSLLGGLLLLYFYFSTPKIPTPPAPPQTTPQQEKQEPTVPQGISGKDNPPPIAQNQSPTGKRTAPPPLVRGGEDASLDQQMAPIFDAVMQQNPPIIPRGGSFDAVAVQMLAHAYGPARARLQEMPAPFAQNDTLHYFTALSWLLEKQPERASAHLFLLNRPESPFRNEAQWLLGLDFLLQGKRDAAINTFKILQKKSGHPRREAAEKLLDALEREQD